MLVSVLGMRYPVDAMQSQISHDHYRRVRLLGFFLGVAGLVFAACLIVQGAGQASKSSKSGEQPVGLLPTNLAPSLGRLPSTKPIEEIRVGDRVLSRNPEVTDAERARWQDPDWEDWLHLRLVMAKDDGSELHIELLRPESWVLERLSYVTDDRVSASTAVGTIANVTLASPQVRRPLTPKGSKRATRIDSDPLSPLRPFYRDIMLTSAELATSGTDLIGITVALDLPEMGAVGTAYVTAVDRCPPISEGAGQPVTATFAHRSSTEVLDIIFEGEDEPIGVTDNHLFWSVDDQRFVPIGEMKIGDRVQTYSGDTKRIAGKLPRPGPQAVYNLEVYGEHVYFVGQQGLLAHNLYGEGNVPGSNALNKLIPDANGGVGKYSQVKGHHVHAKAGFKDAVNYSKSKGWSISQSYMKDHGWDHQAMTNKQRELFNELARSGRPNTLKEHTRIAVEALQAGGATRIEARQLVADSLRNLREQGVRVPTNIPWN
ncbi:polymorphic toxin-type HINT domain-containing protein [Roseiconus lacunae]|uniref:polymorphic toxin-type HINT domain-containing protein n=1 Tax=Roseiconus lacunae TaxID=2605694 RepID=UPI0011F34458|nr:polymorphic toxin-type HINT domain-containing protein [Roseiconus lacunae]